MTNGKRAGLLRLGRLPVTREMPEMARETKFGLLAGLAFIICFAIILANRGRPITNTDFQFAGQAGGLPAAGLSSATNTTYPPGPTAPQAAQTGHDRDPSTVGSQPQPISTSPPAGRAPTSGASLVLVDQGGAESYGGAQEPRTGAVGTRLPSPPAGKSARQRDLQERLDDLSAKLDVIALSQRGGPDARRSQPLLSQAARRTTDASRGPKSASRSQGRRAGVRYTVVPGDTLTKIAADHYGTPSHTAVNAIFDANRSVMTSADDLGVGVELVLPALEGRRRADGLTTSTRSKAPVAAALTRTGASRADPSFRWYQIKKGDGYSSIARTQLGDSSRWPEIFELNKDRFPDPDRIRDGVRIKIPTAGPAQAKEKGR